MRASNMYVNLSHAWFQACDRDDAGDGSIDLHEFVEGIFGPEYLEYPPPPPPVRLRSLREFLEPKTARAVICM